MGRRFCGRAIMVLVVLAVLVVLIVLVVPKQCHDSASVCREELSVEKIDGPDAEELSLPSPTEDPISSVVLVALAVLAVQVALALLVVLLAPVVLAASIVLVVLVVLVLLE